MYIPNMIQVPTHGADWGPPTTSKRVKDGDEPELLASNNAGRRKGGRWRGRQAATYMPIESRHINWRDLSPCRAKVSNMTQSDMAPSYSLAHAGGPA
jgi:hypothetical protein